MTAAPDPDPNPLAVLMCAVAAVCVLSLCGLGLWSCGHEAGVRDHIAQSYPVPCVSAGLGS